MAGEAIGGWGFLVGITLGPGFVAALLWSPFLISERLRALYRSLPPPQSTIASYLLVTVGLSLPYVLGTGAAITVAHNGPSADMATAILNVLIPVSSGYVIGLPVLAIEGLPRVGIDWDPTGYETSTWILLICAAAWYSALFAVPLFLIAAILAMPT